MGQLGLQMSEFQSTLPVRGATAAIQRMGEHKIFQSTLPVRGATFYRGLVNASDFNFNPRPPCGERLGYTCTGGTGGGISIHAPRAGSDVIFSPSSSIRCYFNPRPPCGERPGGARRWRCLPHFNPRPPCGERRCWRITRRKPPLGFQSTPPVRGATAHSLARPRQ